MKKNTLNTVLLVVISLVVFYIALKDDFSNVMSAIFSANLFWIIIAVIFMGVMFYGVSGCILYFLVKPFKKDYKFFDAIKLRYIIQFFNGVTPFAAGGQAAEIYYLKKHEDLSLVKGTMVVVQNFILNLVSLLLFYTTAIIVNHYTHMIAGAFVLKRIIIIVYILIVLLIIGLFLISFSKKMNKFVTKKLIKVFTLRKKEKERRKIIDKWNENIDNFHEAATHFKENPWYFIKLQSLTIISNFFLYITPMVILFSLGSFHELNIFNSLIPSIYTMAIYSFIPTPGGSGGAEYAFSEFFVGIIGQNEIVPLMLIWRFVTYYFGMALGGVMLLIGKRKEDY